MPTRILYVDTEAVWRGGQEQLYGLMVGMKDRGHEVWLASPQGSPLSDRARAAGLRVVAFGQRSEVSPLAILKMCRLLRRVGHLDILHFNTPKPVMAGGLAARWLGVPVTVASRRVNFPLSSILSPLKYQLLTDCVFTVSASIKDTLRSCGLKQGRIDVIYEGVDLDWIDRLRPAPRAAESAGPVVGVVAHLSPEKGHETFLSAVEQLRDRFPGATYLIVGEGRLRGRLEELTRKAGLNSQVVFTGFRNDSEALMKSFDIFCLPSLSEGLSSAILAAMANRLPVVATRVGGILELVVHGKTGLLVAPEDPQGLGNALAQLLESKDLRQEMGSAGRRRIEGSFTLERKLDMTERAYSRLLKSRHVRK